MAAVKPTLLSHPTPELPVADVERAQAHYCIRLGFSHGWLDASREIGSVQRANVPVFFRRRAPPFDGAVHWIHAIDLDATYQEMQSLGANIVDPLATKPWGLRQFTVEDLDGNRFHFHSG